MPTTVPDLARWLSPGDTVLWGQATAEPLTLTRALVAQRAELPRLCIFFGIGCSDTLQSEHADRFDFVGYTGSGHRALVQAGLLDILPVHYSQLPALMRSGALRVDVVLLQVSPPDRDGRYSLGLAHECLWAALGAARVMIAEVNAEVPWTHGERDLGADDFAPLDMPAARGGEVERRIARHVAPWVVDGATLQLGIGSIPDAVLAALVDRRDLGLHSGAVGDGIVALAEAGALTHARKSIDRGVGVAGVLMGSSRLRHWAHRNPALRMCGTDYTHALDVLAAINGLVAINSAIEVDLTGQINAEVAGGTYVGAVGGALDFLRAAQRSRGGVPIVALPSQAGERSRIVAALSGPVSMPRSDAGVIVTEHGAADLRGQTLAQRIERMLAIAAPEQRAALAREAESLLRVAIR